MQESVPQATCPLLLSTYLLPAPLLFLSGQVLPILLLLLPPPLILLSLPLCVPYQRGDSGVPLLSISLILYFVTHARACASDAWGLLRSDRDIEMPDEEPLSDDEDGIPHCVSDSESESESKNES